MPRARRRVDLPDDLPYGERGDLEASQDAVSPIPDTSEIGLSDTPPSRPISAPSEFPNESVFAGASFGPGPGPEALSLPQPVPDLETEALAAVVPLLELLDASGHHTSHRTRQIIRQFRSQVPPEETP